MIGFIIPLKSKKTATSWDYVSKMFERTLRSVCRQTSPEFKVIVVHHEKPKINFSHGNVDYVEVKCVAPESDAWTDKMTDKGRKVLQGLVHIGRYAPSHTMIVDYDDCISKHIAAFVNPKPSCNGWHIESGFRYRPVRKIIYLRRRNFHKICGTAHIIRYDLLNLPEPPEYDRGYGYYRFYIDHEKINDRMRELQTPLEPLPFKGAVYMSEPSEVLSRQHINVINDNRFYMIFKHKGISRRFLELLKIFNCRRLTPAIREEFGLYDIETIGKNR